MANRSRLTSRVPAAALTLLAVVSMPIAAARADDHLRCGSKLVSTGMTQEDVRRTCGEPSATRVEAIPVYARNKNGTVRRTGTTTVDYWTYDRGNTSFPARLKFEEGKLSSIEFERR